MSDGPPEPKGTGRPIGRLQLTPARASSVGEVEADGRTAPLETAGPFAYLERMTTIAFRDGLLAVDSLLVSRGTIRGYQAKGRRIDGGRVAWTGDIGGAAAIVGWIEAGRSGPAPDPEGCSVVWLPDDGPHTLITDGFESVNPDAEFHSWGAGDDLAKGAMAMGATAARAVRVAIDLSTHSGGDVVVIE
jgi:hypothetical protein